MNIRLVKMVDGLFGRLLATLLMSSNIAETQAQPQSILIIRPGGIGDAVLLAPAVNRLKHFFPNISISILAECRNAGVFDLIPAVDHVWRYDRSKELLQALRGSYDVVIDTEQWHRLSAVVARLVRAPVKIGFGTNERRRMFTHVVDYSHEDYEIESFNRLLTLLCTSSAVEPTIPFLVVPAQERVKIAYLIDLIGEKPFVVLFPGASIPERRWGTERFQQVAEALISQGYAVVVVGGGEDQLDGERIVACGGLNLAGRTTLAETAAVLEQSQLLISGDSGVLHIAVGLDVPTVSLFGPGRALKWAPRGDKHILLNKQLPCSPCTIFGTTPPCPYNARCMQEIAVNEVVEAAFTLLKKNGATIADRP